MVIKYVRYRKFPSSVGLEWIKDDIPGSTQSHHKDTPSRAFPVSVGLPGPFADSFVVHEFDLGSRERL